MFQNRFFRKFFHPRFEDIDQVKLVYLLSLIVGLLSALAAAILKNAIHYTHQILTEGITRQSGSYLFLAYPLFGMLLTLFFVRYIVRDNIGHGISRILFAISKKISNVWIRLIAGGVVLGGLIFLFPPLYGEGYDTIMKLLQGNSDTVFRRIKH